MSNKYCHLHSSEVGSEIMMQRGGLNLAPVRNILTSLPDLSVAGLQEHTMSMKNIELDCQNAKYY